MTDKYILDASGEPIPEPDLHKWGKWFETAERHVADETINDSRISTVFLGLDYNYGNGLPGFWETMVFGGPLADECDRCAGCRKDAQAMHDAMKRRVELHLG